MAAKTPETMQALRSAEGNPPKVEQIQIPKPGPGEILVQNKAVTLNPTDWKNANHTSGKVIGCDFAGVIAALGVDVTNGLQVGDRVSGFVHGCWYEDNGSFAEYLVAQASNVMKIPSNLSDEEAASMGIAGCTGVQGCFQRLEIPAPAADIAQLPTITKDSPKLLVWSGATAVGQYAIQLGTIAGYYVITTASPHNADFVKSLGAKEVHNYRDEGVPEKISQAHPDLELAFDCISENGTQQLCVKSLGKSGGKIVVLLKPDKEAIALREDVKIIHTLIYTSLGREITYGRTTFDQERVSTDQAFFKPWLNGDGLLSHLFAKGLLKPNRIKHMDGGIGSIHEGLKYLESGKASGEKLAYTIGA